MANAAKFLQELYSDASLRSNCSGFFKAATFKAAGRKLLPELPADALIDQIRRDGQWVKIGRSTEAGSQAAGYASKGYLVVALLKAAEHLPFRLNKQTHKYDIPHQYHSGHLAIVLPGPTKGGYPYVICGSTIDDGRSDGTKAVKGVWREVDAPNVEYYRTAEVFSLLIPESDRR